MKKIFCSLIAGLILCLALPLGVSAQQNDYVGEVSDRDFVLGAIMKVITIIESEIALQFSFSASAVSDHIDLSKKIQTATGGQSVPGLLRITGGSMEVMIDIENTFLEEDFGDGAVKIYDFNLGSEEGGDSIVVLPEASERSFTIPIGAKAEILSGENIDYFMRNVLSANYL